MINRCPRGLLGTHELRSTHDFVLVGIVADARHLGDTEVCHHCPTGTPLEEDVVGLDVPVDDPLGMSLHEGPGHLAQHPDAVPHRQRSAGSDTLGERLAVNERHHEENEILMLLDGVYRYDVGMGELRGGSGLTQKPLTQRTVEGQLRREELDRHRSVECDVPGEEHDPHAPAAQFAVERVAAGNGLL